MRAIGLVLLALAGHAASAADNDARIAALMTPPPLNWDKVESVSKAADAAPSGTLAGRYSGAMQDLVLSPDGRMARVFNAAGMAAMEENAVGSTLMSGTLGTWSQEGDWLVLNPGEHARAPATAPPSAKALATFREQLAGMFEGLEEDAALDAYEALLQGIDRVDVISSHGSSADPERLLVVDSPDGTLLLDADLLLWEAQAWPGEGPLELQPMHWRAYSAASPYAQPREAHAAFELADPMHASVPLPLRSLLRPHAIEARVLGRVDPGKAIEWDALDADIRLRIDRGADDGLLARMSMYGVPPNERLYATIDSVSAKEAIVALRISRFAPGDTPAIPEKGTVLASRTVRPIACGFDSRAAVRAKVTAVDAPEGGVQRDADGYAYVELEIDQGAHHGLALEDAFEFDGDAVEGEGRVRRLGETDATVLWRTERDWATVFADLQDDEDNVSEEEDVEPAPLVLPQAGQHLATPSWKAAERDVFGKALGDAGAPSSRVPMQ